MIVSLMEGPSEKDATSFWEAALVMRAHAIVAKPKKVPSHLQFLRAYILFSREIY